ncbi:uncharacterized protein ycf36 [Andrographis paniculata]|uniref:uncharacterized protein ycf36 n=1 Tax=Andrographis paniculata TaxID=175694 RepID=UPI0021E83184|nr:uncharacterized protein ycf36 [Andrographis paniculata]
MASSSGSSSTLFHHLLLYRRPGAAAPPQLPYSSSSFSSRSSHWHSTLTLIPKSKYHDDRRRRRLWSSFKNRPETECPVPVDQQPMKEYEALADSFPFSWASADLVEYCSRLFATGAFFALFVGLPVSWVGSKSHEPLSLALGAASSGLFVAILAVVRMYLGWAYVGNRLLSATVEYEETGWYDGQIWVKTAEVLARDRLLGSFSVKPVLGRLKNSLVVLGISLLICIVLLVNSDDNNNNSNVGLKNASFSISSDHRRAIPGVYNDEAARNFEPDAFCGDQTLVQ